MVITDKIEIKPIIRLRELSKIYSSSGAVAVGLHKVNLELFKGEFVAITGSSGSGKSTLLNVMSCMDSYEEGELFLLGEETSYFTEADRAEYRKKYVAFIFQDYNIIDSYTVYQNVELALLSRYSDKAERHKRIIELLDKVGLTSHAKHRATKLSGGQKQRVSIARALAKDAPILFADEPTGNLDSKTGAEILGLLKELSHDKLVLVVTHSYDEIAEYATRKVRLADGDIVEDTVLNAQVRLPCDAALDTEPPKEKDIKGISVVAKNNILATPKRSIFSFTSLIALSAMFIWIIIGLLSYNTVSDFYNDTHKNDIQVIKLPTEPLDEADILAISEVEGVAAVNYYISIINNGAQYTVKEEHFYARIRPASTFDGVLFSGRLPQADNEVVITIPPRKNFTSAELLDTKVKLYYNIEETEFTVVGVIADDVNLAVYLNDNLIQSTPVAYFDNDNRHNALVASVADSSMITEARMAIEAMGYLTYYPYSGASAIDASRLIIFLFSLFVAVIMLYVFRAVQGSVKTVGESKKRDYNIMRTVGLSDNYIKAVYYFEMAFLALSAWITTVVLSFVGVLVYSLIVTPGIVFGFKLIASGIARFAWVSIIALVVTLFVTMSNAQRFNKRFFKHTVKNSLLEE